MLFCPHVRLSAFLLPMVLIASMEDMFYLRFDLCSDAVGTVCSL